MSLKATPYSSLKLFAHTDKIEAIRKGERTAPLYVRIKPTNYCNQGCSYCHYSTGQYLDLEGQESQNLIPWEIMQGVIRDFSDIGVKAITFSGGGEPLMYPKIIDTMKMVLDKNIDLSIITNGSLLSGERAELLTQAKWVRISLDSARPETYSVIRKIPLKALENVYSNIAVFAKTKQKNCELGINYVISHENSDEIYLAAEKLKAAGVNHIKFAARITTDVAGYHTPIKDKVIEQIHQANDKLVGDGFKIINLYEEDFNLSSTFIRPYKRCVIKEIVCVVAADCKVYHCHDKAYLKNGIIGDLREKSFRDIWFSSEAINCAKEFDAHKECCHHCVYDNRNILLNTFLALEENHINFI
jgi:MoaA/NifB/PqqE/SkfB family radical SAM enzyme